MPTALARAVAPAPSDGIAARTLWAVTRAWLRVGTWWVGKVLVLRGVAPQFNHLPPPIAPESPARQRRGRKRTRRTPVAPDVREA